MPDINLLVILLIKTGCDTVLNMIFPSFLFIVGIIFVYSAPLWACIIKSKGVQMQLAQNELITDTVSPTPKIKKACKQKLLGEGEI